MFLQHSNLTVASCERDHRAMRLNSADHGSITGHGATRRIVVCFRHKINSPVRESCNHCLSNPTRGCCTFSNTILSLTGPSLSVFSCVRFYRTRSHVQQEMPSEMRISAYFTGIGRTQEFPHPAPVQTLQKVNDPVIHCNLNRTPSVNWTFCREFSPVFVR
jgi:hypothetical protein